MSPPKPSWTVFLFDIILAILVRLPIMSGLIRRISSRLDYHAESDAPLDTDGARPRSGVYEREAMQLQTLISKPMFTLSELPALVDFIKNNIFGTGIDDRKMLLEHLIVTMSNGKELSASLKIQQFLISLLYKDLPHPPSGYVALPAPISSTNPSFIRKKYAYRSADGSNYNPLMPSMGMAGSPYARSVASTNNAPQTALPDAGLVFDTLLKRDKFVPHPGGISSLFFGFADLVIHSIFNTDHSNPLINKTSSYLDLSILYGNSEKEIDGVRRKDGTGRLLDDVFADYRLLMMPPASCALLVLLSRNHNFIAQRILDINEFKSYNTALNFSDDDAGKAQKLEQDDEIFDRARLVNCGYFMNIILGDYVGAILGLVRDQSDWRLDPLMTIRDSDHAFTPVGEGNVVSIEFNLLYRWHATLSREDTQWFDEGVFKRIFPDKNPADLEPKDFVKVAHKIVREQASATPDKWTFNSLKRQGPDGTGRFADGDLAKILQDATDWHAGAFGARSIPETLRVVELMAIEQSREWGTCSLNEFRKFLGLKPYTTFKEWNSNHQVHTAAAALYKDIDNLELHVGLQAEETKIPGPGAGLCPGFTISRAILADAVCLTRGDRFMTVELTPHNLTAWGYQDCQFDTKDGSFGGMLTKLLFRTLPDYYPKKSVYAHFPFMQPDSMKEVLKGSNPGQIPKYDWTRPKPRPKTVPVYSYADVKRVLTEKKEYTSSFESQLFTVVEPTLIKKPTGLGGLSRHNSNIGTGHSEEYHNKVTVAIQDAKTRFVTGTTALSQAIFSKSSQETANYFKEKARYLVETKKIDHIAAKLHYVDLIRDVVNLLPIHWLSQNVAGFPLKTATNPKGLWYEDVTYDKFADISEYVYLDFDPVNDWRLREASQANAHECIEAIKDHAERAWISNSYPVLKKLWEEHGSSKGASHREFSCQFFAAVVPTAALYSQALAHIIDFYLDDDKQSIREEIVKLADSEQDKSAEIMAYVYEALRLRPITAGVYRVATKDDSLESTQIKATDFVFASIADANVDTSVFGSDALTANASRATKQPVMLGFNHGFLNPAFFESTVPAVLGAIFSFKELKRGPKTSGQLLSFQEEFHGVKRVLYPSQRGLVSPWPESLIVQYTS